MAASEDRGASSGWSYIADKGTFQLTNNTFAYCYEKHLRHQQSIFNLSMIHLPTILMIPLPRLPDHRSQRRLNGAATEASYPFPF
jgi:hypothetical protein